ncbi:phosphopantetheine-binding protein [Streptomyces sp. NBC_01306]|uniref:phosphopantetheine-binding protein n=1 Tax=Streptomyces sp. NBC_01306 TaxID=2903819 RepID=UPI0022550FA8|nr:phosphopantetheine-binding protein [Streptomyces sp. NBC_01306]MCX4725059.1 phosphopantetheine-binding protein [Streptomyces sp. NBC_01306]
MPDNALTAPADLELLRTLWREVLEIKEVADDVNFFDAGGDSLRLVALVERIRLGTGLRVRTMDVLQAATVRGQADLLAGLERG